MIARSAVAGIGAPLSGALARVTAAWQATVSGLALVLLSVVSLAVAVSTVLSIVLVPLGVGLLLVPATVHILRRTAWLGRVLAKRSGIDITSPRPQAPRFEVGIVGIVQRCQWLLTDPTTWRELAWVLLTTVLGFVAGLLPITLIAYAIEGVAMTAGGWLLLPDAFWYGFWPMTTWAEASLGAVLGVVLAAVWVRTAPAVQLWHALLCAALLGPTERTRLAQRVRRLTDTRADALDIQAAEIRRIERDLHDGAQARLVAIGMKLSIAATVVERDPPSAKVMIVEAQDASQKALEELRNLVRGVHPPLLVERGLGDAVQALVMETPMDVDLTVDLTGRLPAPVETTAYFAASELLTHAVPVPRFGCRSPSTRHTPQRWLNRGRPRRRSRRTRRAGTATWPTRSGTSPHLLSAVRRGPTRRDSRIDRLCG